MPADAAKTDLHHYLRQAREVLVWKLDGLSEYDVRRPMVPSGTNLLGLVKHLASVELGYLGDCMGRPSGEPLPWFDDDAEPDADLWATADEARDDIVALYRRAWAHSDATIEALDLDAVGHVPWWGDGDVTLHRLLVHLVAETNRHGGHADILREEIDAAIGHRAGNDNLPEVEPDWWPAHHDRLEAVARAAAGPDPLRPPG